MSHFKTYTFSCNACSCITKKYALALTVFAIYYRLNFRLRFKRNTLLSVFVVKVYVYTYLSIFVYTHMHKILGGLHYNNIMKNIYFYFFYLLSLLIRRRGTHLFPTRIARVPVVIRAYSWNPRNDGHGDFQTVHWKMFLKSAKIGKTASSFLQSSGKPPESCTTRVPKSKYRAST